MKPIMAKAIYMKHLGRVIYRLHWEFLAVAFLGVFLYEWFYLHLVNQGILELESFIATVFFRSVIVWAVFYFGKRLYLTTMVDRIYSGESDDGDTWFIPAGLGTKVFTTQIGRLCVDSGSVYFLSERVKKDPVLFEIPKTQVDIHVVLEDRNVMLPLLWGEKEVLELKNVSTGEAVRLLIPNPEETGLAIKGHL